MVTSTSAFSHLADPGAGTMQTRGQTPKAPLKKTYELEDTPEEDRERGEWGEARAEGQAKRRRESWTQHQGALQEAEERQQCGEPRIAADLHLQDSQDVISQTEAAPARAAAAERGGGQEANRRADRVLQEPGRAEARDSVSS
ncbi:hypothetical protein ON010_g14385 [Phytophthora cinnamomi]|nr:hypothetical protein ON010_g14385 [Phytophthora cinnamomi]